jgi:uncharacterized membrane protein
VTIRQAIALLAVAGAFVASYLFLYNVGATGALACGVGSCDVVQSSPYAVLFGVPVSGWGILGYVAILAVALAGLRSTWAGHRGIAIALAALAGAGFAFSTYLTVVELFVLRAICVWCVASYALITAIFALAALDLRRRRRGGPSLVPFGERA